jgi:hypothetical protein
MTLVQQELQSIHKVASEQVTIQLKATQTLDKVSGSIG